MEDGRALACTSLGLRTAEVCRSHAGRTMITRSVSRRQKKHATVAKVGAWHYRLARNARSRAFPLVCGRACLDCPPPRSLKQQVLIVKP